MPSGSAAQNSAFVKAAAAAGGLQRPRSTAPMAAISRLAAAKRLHLPLLVPIGSPKCAACRPQPLL
jgi:hypothetical protein